METRTVAIGLLIGLLLGSSGMYLFNNNQISQIEDEILTYQTDPVRVSLQNELSELGAQLSEYNATKVELESKVEDENQAIISLANLEEELQTLNQTHNTLLTDYQELSNQTEQLQMNVDELTEYCSDYDDLVLINETYSDLVGTLESLDAMNQTQVVEFYIKSGTETFTFELPHGIFIDIEIKFSDDRSEIWGYWRKDDLTDMMGGSTRTIAGYSSLTGIIRVSYFNNEAGSLMIRSVVVTNIPSVQRTFDVRLGVS